MIHLVPPVVIVETSTPDPAIWMQPAFWISIFAVLVAFVAVWERRRASSAQHVQLFSEDYDSIEMYEALRTMRHWVDGLKGHDPNEVARAGMRALQKQSGRPILGGPITHENQPAYIDAMRRRVTSYFERLCQFREAWHLRHKDFVMLITTAGERLMVAAVAPLQHAKIDLDLERLSADDVAGRAREERWRKKFDRHLELIQDPKRRTVWKQWYRRRIKRV